MINVRSLLGQVRLHRPDLKDSIIDFYMQESIRRLCRQTMILQDESSITVSANANTYTISKSGYDINRVHMVELQLSNGKYKILEEVNIIDINNKVNEQHEIGIASHWGFDVLKNELRIYPITKASANLRVKYSIIPQGEILDITLPPDAEEAILFGCLSEIYIIPGPAMNLQMAQNYKIQRNNEISNIKSIAILGNSGTLTMKPNPIGGRRKNGIYNPYGW